MHDNIITYDTQLTHPPSSPSHRVKLARFEGHLALALELTKSIRATQEIRMSKEKSPEKSPEKKS